MTTYMQEEFEALQGLEDRPTLTEVIWKRRILTMSSNLL